MYAENAYCLNMEDFYISGDPKAISYAGLVIGMLRSPKVQLDWREPDYDENKIRYYEFS